MSNPNHMEHAISEMASLSLNSKNSQQGRSRKGTAVIERMCGSGKIEAQLKTARTVLVTPRPGPRAPIRSSRKEPWRNDATGQSRHAARHHSSRDRRHPSGVPAMNRKKINPRKKRRIRLAVYKRDGYACLHCGWKPEIPEGYDGSYALGSYIVGPKGGRLMWLELDHIRPYILGGPFTVDNLQALCSGCNNRKGAKV